MVWTEQEKGERENGRKGERENGRKREQEKGNESKENERRTTDVQFCPSVEGGWSPNVIVCGYSTPQP